jgi:hypothetical protein
MKKGSLIFHSTLRSATMAPSMSHIVWQCQVSVRIIDMQLHKAKGMSHETIGCDQQKQVQGRSETRICMQFVYNNCSL